MDSCVTHIHQSKSNKGRIKTKNKWIKSSMFLFCYCHFFCQLSARSALWVYEHCLVVHCVRVLWNRSQLNIVLFLLHFRVYQQVQLVMRDIVVSFVAGLVELFSPVGRGVLRSVDDVVFKRFRVSILTNNYLCIVVLRKGCWFCSANCLASSCLSSSISCKNLNL